MYVKQIGINKGEKIAQERRKILKEINENINLNK